MTSNILPLFWNLASSSKDSRLNASAELIDTLEQFQQAHIGGSSSNGQAQSNGDLNGDEESADEDEDEDDDESGMEVDSDSESGEEDAAAKRLDRRLSKENAEDVVYTIKRLVRGLGSSRDSSRLGFAVALTELLSRLSSITPAQTLSLLLRSTQTSKNNKGAENRDLLFARLFGLNAIISSGSLFSLHSSVNELDTVLVNLLELGQAKGWIRESAWWGIVQVLEGLLGSSVGWKDEGVKVLVQRCFVDDKSWSAEKVALTLILEKGKPDLDWKALLAPTFRYRPLLSSGNLVTLGPILKESDIEDDDEEKGVTSTGSWKPQLHFVWNIILDQYYAPDAVAQSGRATFQDFFRVVVDESLFSNTSSSERKYWGFSIVLLALPLLPANQLPQIFTPNFMRSWMNNLSSSDRYLHKSALQIARSVQDVVKANPTAGFTLLSQLVGKHGRADFDKVTKTKVVEGIMGNLSVEGVGEFVEYLQGVILGRDQNGEPSQERRHWALDQFQSLCRNSSLPKDDKWISSVLDFLLVHGFFVIKKTDKKSPIAALHSTPKPPLSETTATLCRARFFSCLVELTTATPSFKSDQPKQTRQPGCDASGALWISKVIDTILACETDRKHLEVVMDADAEIATLRERTRETLGAIKKSSADADVKKGVQILLSFLLLQTYDETEDALDLLEETLNASQALLAIDSSSSSSATPEDPPIDTLLDTLIALLDKGSNDLRSLANLVLGLLSSALTKSSFDHLNAQLENTVAEAAAVPEDDDVGASSSDEEVDDDEENEDEEEEGSSESDDEEEEDDEDEDDSAPVDPAFRARVAEALKLSGMDVDENGAGDSDDDDESDEEVWDDEQMMKVDEQLAAVFRSQAAATRRKPDKNVATESLHFKSRILDFYEVYARKQSTNPLITSLILPLLNLVRSAGKTQTDLFTKASSILRTRFGKAKEVPSTADIASTTELLQAVHDLAKKSPSKEFTSVCSGCSIFLARTIDASAAPSVSAGAGAGAGAGVIEVYSGTLKEFMTNKHTLLHASFLLDFVKRFPVRSWGLHTTLATFLSSGSGVNPYRQVQAYDLVNIYATQLRNISAAAAAAEEEGEVKAFVRTTIQSFYSLLRSAGEEKEKESGSGSGWNAGRMKEVVKSILALARGSKNLPGIGEGESVWDVAELSEVIGECAASRVGRQWPAIMRLLQQLLAIVSGSGSGSGAKANGKSREKKGITEPAAVKSKKDKKEKEKDGSKPSRSEKANGETKKRKEVPAGGEEKRKKSKPKAKVAAGASA